MSSMIPVMRAIIMSRKHCPTTPIGRPYLWMWRDVGLNIGDARIFFLISHRGVGILNYDGQCLYRRWWFLNFSWWCYLHNKLDLQIQSEGGCTMLVEEPSLSRWKELYRCTQGFNPLDWETKYLLVSIVNSIHSNKFRAYGLTNENSTA